MWIRENNHSQTAESLLWRDGGDERRAGDRWRGDKKMEACKRSKLPPFFSLQPAERMTGWQRDNRMEGRKKEGMRLEDKRRWSFYCWRRTSLILYLSNALFQPLWGCLRWMEGWRRKITLLHPVIFLPLFLSPPPHFSSPPVKCRGCEMERRAGREVQQL